MKNEPSISEIVQDVLDEYAADASPEYRNHAEKFRRLDRWTGSDPVLLVADAAGSASGLNYKNIVKPHVEQFRERFVETGDVTTLADLAELESDPKFAAEFTVGRPNIVYEVPQALLERTDSETDDLTLLQTWARNADPERYRTDPIGSISGIGIATFQYLRMIAGVDTAKPDIQVEKFIEELRKDHPSFELCTDSKTDVLQSCRWLSEQSTYSLVEIDQIAWWTFTDTETLPAH